MLTRQIGLAGAILGANVRSPDLPYKVTFVATYHCNFRCEMCNIWQKKSVNEMTPDEVGLFFDRYPQFRWVHLTGGELFMRRDLDDLVAAIQKHCRSLFLLNFPTTGWFGDKTVSLVERTLARGVGRLMTTISIDGPKALHEEMRGLPGSWDKGIETFRRLRGIKKSNFQTVVGMTLMAKNADRVDETLAAIRQVIPDFRRSELHLYACSIWDAKVGNLRDEGFDLQTLWNSDRRRELREDVVDERCSHCWTPCEAYPTILGNLALAATTRGTAKLQPAPVGT